MDSEVKSNKKYLVQFMGMSSNKFGGLERFIISLSQSLKKENIFLILVYNSLPISELYLKKLHDNEIILFTANAQSPLAMLNTIIKIKRKYNPHLLHSHFQPVFSCLFGVVIGFKERWVSLRTMLHDKKCSEKVEPGKLSLKARICRFIVNHTATRFFAVSKAVRIQYSCMYPGIEDKIETFYMGADENNCDRKKIRHQLHLNDEIVYICCVAFALPIKGIDILIYAIKLLKHKMHINNFELCLIGLDEKLDYTINLKRQIDELELESSVKLLGIKDNIPELLKAMDIYCQPSRSEAISMTLMEAAMASLPLVGSKVGGIPEIVIENKTGFLFDSGNSTQLAFRLKSLILNKKLRIQLGENALNYALKNFDRAHQIEKMKEIYIENFADTDKKH